MVTRRAREHAGKLEDHPSPDPFHFSSPIFFFSSNTSLYPCARRPPLPALPDHNIMPSSRRTKALFLALISVITLSLFLTFRSSGSSAGPRYLEQLKTFRPRSAEPPSAFPAAASEIENLKNQHTILIFSKTYCPYSKKAKALLLDKYKIVPPPFVVELDIRPDMADMQGRLKELTGRATVPVGFYPERRGGSEWLTHGCRMCWLRERRSVGVMMSKGCIKRALCRIRYAASPAIALSRFLS
jgi:glutaredoxin